MSKDQLPAQAALVQCWVEGKEGRTRLCVQSLTLSPKTSRIFESPAGLGSLHFIGRLVPEVWKVAVDSGCDTRPETSSTLRVQGCHSGFGFGFGLSSRFQVPGVAYMIRHFPFPSFQASKDWQKRIGTNRSSYGTVSGSCVPCVAGSALSRRRHHRGEPGDKGGPRPRASFDTFPSIVWPTSSHSSAFSICLLHVCAYRAGLRYVWQLGVRPAVLGL